MLDNDEQNEKLTKSLKKISEINKIKIPNISKLPTINLDIKAPSCADIFTPTMPDITFDNFDFENNTPNIIIKNQQEQIAQLKEYNLKKDTEIVKLQEITTTMQDEFKNLKNSSKKNSIITWITWAVTTLIAIGGLIISILSLIRS